MFTFTAINHCMLTPHHNSPQKRTLTKQNWQFTHKSNFEARSPNRCCRGRGASIKYYMSVSVLLL
jgi:alpha-glucuronidase